MAGGTIAVLDTTKIYSTIADGCVYEFQQVICKSFNCRQIELTNSQHSKKELAADDTQFLETCEFVFIVSINIHAVAAVLRASGKCLTKVKQIIIYVFDPFIHKDRIHWDNYWLRMLPSYRMLASMKNATLFMPVHPIEGRLKELLRMDVHFMPIGVDLCQLEMKNSSIERVIDVNAYGRQPLDMLSCLRNRAPAEFVLYWTMHTQLGACYDVRGQRDLFWRLLQMSKIALAYDPMQCDPSNRFNNLPFVPQRLFESLAAGCVVVGKRPTADEFHSLLGWENSCIELDGDWNSQADQVIELVKNTQFLNETRKKNLEMIKAHDWRLRLKEMTRILGISLEPIPT